MTARPSGVVSSQVCHGSSRHSGGLFWFSIDRDMWGERDDSICGQKIHILPTGPKSKRWRQLRKNERPGNSEFVSSYVWGEKTSNVPLITVGVQLVLDFILLIQYVVWDTIYLLNIASMHLNVTFSTGIIDKFPGSFVLANCLYILKNELNFKKRKSHLSIFFRSSHKM